MIASPGLLKTLEEATGTNQVNKELALLVVEQVNNLLLFECFCYFVLCMCMCIIFLFLSYEYNLH